MIRHLTIPALLIALLAGCASDNTIVTVNQEPTITWLFDPLGVQRGNDVTLGVAVSDPDEDDILRVTWTSSNGAIVPQTGNDTRATWSAPVTNGVATITVSVTDGESTIEISEDILICTRFLSDEAASVYEKAQSPYLLVSSTEPPNILVTQGLTSVVEAGVELLVEQGLTAGTVIDVQGTLRANGTASEPVVIRPNRRQRCGDETIQYFKGFRVGGPQGRLELNHADVTYAEDAVFVREGGSAIIRNTEIKCCRDNGVLFESTGQLIIDGCEITNNKGHGIQLDKLSAPLPSSIDIIYSDVSINGGTGILVKLADPGATVPINIQRNRVTVNSENGIFLQNSSFPEIHENEIWFNNVPAAQANIKLHQNFAAGDTLDITCNFWGGAYQNPASVDGLIFDQADNSQIATRLKFTPWRITSPVGSDSLKACP